MFIFRYLVKEVSIALGALTSILLLIFMSNQLVSYLNRAAHGQIPGLFIMHLMLLELPTLLCLLLPLGFYMALLLAYGRLYADSEMTVLQACGYGPLVLLRHSMVMAFFVASFVLVVMLWFSPLIAVERATLLRTAGMEMLIKTLMPQRFNILPGGQQVFYIESMDSAHTEGRHIFVAQHHTESNASQWDILWANAVRIAPGQHGSDDALILEKGHAYRGAPGQADYQLASFKEYRAPIPHPNVDLSPDLRTLKTSALLPWHHPTLDKVAEFQWRISIPMMVLTLTMVAVPLSRLNPRTGKYAKLIPALLIYMVYANFMFVAKGWLLAGKTPVFLGMWWLHGLVFLLGIGLMVHHWMKPA